MRQKAERIAKLVAIMFESAFESSANSIRQLFNEDNEDQTHLLCRNRLLSSQKNISPRGAENHSSDDMNA